VIRGDRRLELVLVEREERLRRRAASDLAGGDGAAVLLARRRLQLGEAFEAQRTTVDDEVFARRASSSAVWKATSSR